MRLWGRPSSANFGKFFGIDVFQNASVSVLLHYIKLYRIQIFSNPYIFLFYNPRKRQKTPCFLTFSGGVEREYKGQRKPVFWHILRKVAEICLFCKFHRKSLQRSLSFSKVFRKQDSIAVFRSAFYAEYLWMAAFDQWPTASVTFNLLVSIENSIENVRFRKRLRKVLYFQVLPCTKLLSDLYNGL